jgi:putative endopeptidase
MRAFALILVAAALFSLRADAKDRAAAADGLDLGAMDRAVAPGDDFFAYTNGAWLARTAIPPDRSDWGIWAVLPELTEQRTNALIAETLQAAAPAGSEARKIADYYASFMDEAAIERLGVSPLRPALTAIAAIGDPRGLARALGATLRADVDPLNFGPLDTLHLFGLWVAQDLDDPHRYLPFLLQGGLTMPDRDFYLDASPRMAALRDQHRAHVAKMLSLAGSTDANAKAERICRLERRIAEQQATRVESKDVAKADNHWSRRDFATRAPGLDWEAFFTAAQLGGQGSFVVWQPAAIAGLARLVHDEPLETWKELLTYHAIDEAAPFLSKAFVDESFAFHDSAINGTPKLRERWKRATAATNDALGDAVGKLYVTRYFPPAVKTRAEEMVRNLVAAYARRIDRLTWMAPATRASAKAKLGTLKVSIGYPERWRDYSGLDVVRGDALGNFERSSLLEYRRQLDKLGRAVDRGEWGMPPQIVNAYNLPAMNALIFPAAILQAPFFDPSRPTVMDYGAAGFVIGHEISHSFDDQGALFDAEGRRRNWWTRDDFTHFAESSVRLARQVGEYRPFPELHVDGKLTSTENIADVAGLAAAYDAYRLSYGGKEASSWRDLSGDQQFFISYGQCWQTKMREEAERTQLLTDGHAPDRFRADVVRNLDEWYGAFSVTPRAKLFLPPGDRIRVW